MNNKTHILAVIPCLNEEEHLDALVRDLVNSSSELAVRFVIADGGSADRTPEIAKKLAAQYPNVLVLHNPNRHQGAALNLAVREHGRTADVLIRLDAHAAYPVDYLAVLVDEYDVTQAASVVVSMRTIGNGLFQRAVAAAQNSKLGNGGSPHRNMADGMWVDHGHHALMTLHAFRAVGGYDEAFSHNEDAELDLRLLKAGYRIWLTGRTCLTYYPRTNAVALFRQYYRFGVGRAQTILKHRIVPKLRQQAPALVAPALLIAALGPALPIAVLPVVAWATTCLAYGAIVGLTARDARLALSGPAAMIMHLAWSLGFWSGMLVPRKVARIK